MSARSKFLVLFKDEDEVEGLAVGPVRVIDVDAADADPNAAATGMPGVYSHAFGYSPPWCEEKGWMSKPEAVALARSLGAELTEV